jgi:quercetin dioxygenase-like cupin family protein
MRIYHSDPFIEKGWLTGAWDPDGGLDIPDHSRKVNIGFANRGIDEPHQHTRITEIYLVGRGSAQVRFEQQTITLIAGDLLVIEPGEAHTFLYSSPDYFHFVLHIPGLAGEEARLEKVLVGREHFGL